MKRGVLRARRERWESSGTLEPEFATVIVMLVGAATVTILAVLSFLLDRELVLPPGVWVGGAVALWLLLVGAGWLSMVDLDRRRARERSRAQQR
jgi:hypothetical protein